MLNNCNYNKVRLLYDLSRIEGYLKRHAKADAKRHGHVKCHKLCVDMEKDVEKHIKGIRMAIIELAKKGKFD